MHCLDPLQIKSWLSRIHLAGADFLSGHVHGYVSSHLGNLSHFSAAQSMAVPRAIDARLWSTDPPQCLVWVVEHGIWSSSENLSLYYCWRVAMGVSTPLEDASGHVFLPFERDHMCSLVQLACLFGWGLICVAGDGTAGFTIDHDGKMIAFGNSVTRTEQLTAGFPSGRA